MFTTEMSSWWQVIFFALFVRPFLTLFVGVRVLGKENLPDRGPFVLIANHSSHLDAATLLNLFPLSQLHRIRPCAAADYFERTPLTSFLSHAFLNILGIHRKNITRETHPVVQMKACLDRGEALILFPEGTRGCGGEIAPFKPGIVHLIEEIPTVPIVPVRLTNLHRSLPKGEFIPIPIFGEVCIGKALFPRGTREEILQQLQKAVVECQPV